MSVEEYRAALAALNMTQSGFATWLGAHSQVGRQWAAKGAPNQVAKLLRLMVALDAGPEWVDARIEEKRAAPRQKASP